jgi:hypothetical protein
MTRAFSRLAGVLAAVLCVAAPASAQVVSSFQVGLGGFFPRGLNSRASGDVLVRNHDGESLGISGVSDALAFEISDFRTLTGFGEYNLGFGPHLEVGFGISGYGRHVPTLYRDIEEGGTGLDIEQELSMRVVPFTVLARFMPFGDASTVQPYVGAGVAILSYRYTEEGDFVDSDTLEIFTDHFHKSGTTTGAVLAGGVRFPIKGDIYAVALEGRYLYGVGDTGGSSNGFLADKIDLGGAMLNVGFIVRF